MAATAAHSASFAFQSLDPPRSSYYKSSSSSSLPTSLLRASRRRPNNGFDPSDGGAGDDNSGPRKYSIDDSKSYGRARGFGGGDDNGGEGVQISDDPTSGMAGFFAAHGEWEPLFRGILLGNGDGVGGDDELSLRRTAATAAMAYPILLSSGRDDELLSPDLWGISTLERRNPWRLLPSKPTSESSLRALSSFLDEWQRSLLDIPLDALITGENDRHFLEEGRRTIAVTRFHVLDDYHRDEDDSEDYVGGTNDAARAPAVDDNNREKQRSCDWETELFRTCWSELAHLTYKDECNTGSLVLVPDLDIIVSTADGIRKGRSGLDVVRDFVERDLIRPMRWLGRDSDWEIVAMERGGVAVRMLYKLGDIPELER
ncbi:hypothetical protein ACHAXA_006402 [Cyclostephanos tholiformis]|uniref:Uncharacterized protein n=1 Tax=Cyclostephanos tholiformis TaxID=382380 RepID=A0ABD3SDK5_9STRA